MIDEAWFALVTIGPVLLISVIYWALWRNSRTRGRRKLERTEQATRDLRKELREDPHYRQE